MVSHRDFRVIGFLLAMPVRGANQLKAHEAPGGGFIGSGERNSAMDRHVSSVCGGRLTAAVEIEWQYEARLDIDSLCYNGPVRLI